MNILIILERRNSFVYSPSAHQRLKTQDSVFFTINLKPRKQCLKAAAKARLILAMVIGTLRKKMNAVYA